jgi:EAL domain-containing protein (putative c-di-GMP-specific phosphodiesterase class I)/CheY-like chemotaxis protein
MSRPLHGLESGRLLVVDDDLDACRFVCEAARGCGFEVESARTAEDFERHFAAFRPEVILLDLSMPDVDGVEILHRLAREGSRARIVPLSGFDGRVRQAAVRVGTQLGLRMEASLAKPITGARLQEVLGGLLPLGARIGRDDLGRAVAQREFFLLYQPKIEMASGRVCGVEALARWDHPELGIVPPDAFVPAFERAGLAAELSRVVLDMAARQVTAWREAGLETTVAVNVSAPELAVRSFPERVFGVLDAWQLDPRHLVIEITETGAMEDVVRAADVLVRLRLKGVAISLDDFGTGYSSMAWLHRLPFSELKVDRSFVLELGKGGEADLLVKAMVELAHNLGLEVCAEGVETAEAWDRLRALGCERVQGFAVSRPLPGDDLPAWIRAWGGRPSWQ